MEKVIIYTGENGNVIVVVPTGEIPIESVQQKDIPPGVESFIVEKNSLPLKYEYFFNAWEQNNGIVTVNIEKAKEIHKKWLRIDRAELFEKLDVAFQRALETNSDTSKIVQEKQRLRDITILVDNQTTLDEILSIKAELQIVI